MPATLHPTVVYSSGTGHPQTVVSGVQSFTSGRRIYVATYAQCWYHTQNFSWSISDDASTNTVTWTEVGTSPLDTFESSRATQVKVWVSSELTANESFTITVDPNDTVTNDYFSSMLVWEVSGGDGTLEQAIVFDLINNSDTNTVDFGSTPGNAQVVCCFQNSSSSTSDWDAAPANWTKSLEADGNTGNGQKNCAVLLTSTTNTATAVTQSMTNPNTSQVNWMVALEFADAGANPSGNADIAVTASAAGQREAFGNATSSLSVTASATGIGGASGSGSTDVVVTASATGLREAVGSGNADVVISTSATGVLSAFGEGSAAVAVTASATGVRETPGSGATSLSVTASATGRGEAVGQASAAVAVSAAAFGVRTAIVGGGFALAITASATGQRDAFGQGSAGISVTGSASGSREITRAGALAATITTSATGVREAFGQGAVLVTISTEGLGRFARVVGSGGVFGADLQAQMEARAYDERLEMLGPPVDCPNDGSMLVAHPSGVLVCPFDGWVYRGEPVTW